MAAAALLISFIAAYSVYKFINLYFRHLRAHQFFKHHAPHLPLYKPQNTIMGSMLDLVYHPKNCQLFTKLHEKLGPTFCLYVGEAPWVTTKDLDVIKLIEMDDPYKHILRQPLNFPFLEADHSIAQVNTKSEWQRIRKAIAPALTNHKVRSADVSDDIQIVVDKLIEGLEARLTRAAGPKVRGSERSMIIDIEDAAHRYTMEVIFLITYKRAGEIDFKSDHDSWVDYCRSGIRYFINPITLLSIVFPFLRPLTFYLVRLSPVGKLNRRIVNFIEQAAEENKAAREKHERSQEQLGDSQQRQEFSTVTTFKRRLVDYLLDAVFEKKITYDHFMGTALFAFIAGFETTAATITYMSWQLAQRPNVQEKLRKALIEKGSDAEYLHWCIMETVRMYPPVPLAAGRILGEDIEVNGVFYPKGAYVQPTTYAIHYDPKIWPEPEEFKPERWEDTSKNHPAAFLGFGLGPRNCAGGKLAVQEVKLLMRTLITKYRFEKCEKTVKKFEFSSPASVFTTPDEDIIIRLVELDKPEVIKAAA